MKTIKKKDIKSYKPKAKGVEEEFKSKKQQRYFYAKANDETLPKAERAKWKKWAEEYSDETDFDEIPEKVTEEELEELVNSSGGSISGGRTPSNNSEIETAPQATTDRFAQVAIQPNRYLYNVTGNAYSRGAHVNAESYDAAKEKLINLLEDMPAVVPRDDNMKFIDGNENQIDDINELPPNIASKLNGLLKTLEMNNTSPEQIELVMNVINTRLNQNNAQQ